MGDGPLLACLFLLGPSMAWWTATGEIRTLDGPLDGAVINVSLPLLGLLSTAEVEACDPSMCLAPGKAPFRATLWILAGEAPPGSPAPPDPDASAPSRPGRDHWTRSRSLRRRRP